MGRVLDKLLADTESIDGVPGLEKLATAHHKAQAAVLASVRDEMNQEFDATDFTLEQAANAIKNAAHERVNEIRRERLAKQGPENRSAHGTVVTCAMILVQKGKSPSAAAKAVAKKFSGYENMFLGPGPSLVKADELEHAIWSALADTAIKMMKRIEPGREADALDGTAWQYAQNESAAFRPKLREAVIRKLGHDPFRGSSTSPRSHRASNRASRAARRAVPANALGHLLHEGASKVAKLFTSKKGRAR